MSDNKIRHLEMIQGIINRMAGNSFSLKGWAVTLEAGLFALASKEADKLYFIIVYIPVLIFWGLDAFYLREERIYRELYNIVRNKLETEIDFDMDISLLNLQDPKFTFWNAFLSSTEKCFYLPLVLLSAIIIMIAYLPQMLVY